METVTISYTYNVKCYVHPYYIMTECGKIINIKKGIECKQFLRGKHKAVYIDGVINFVDELKPIHIEKCPF
jgi:hypothetical protein